MRNPSFAILRDLQVVIITINEITALLEILERYIWWVRLTTAVNFPIDDCKGVELPDLNVERMMTLFTYA